MKLYLHSLVDKLKWLATYVTKLKWLATDVTKLKWLATDVMKLKWLATDVTKLKWLATDVTKLKLLATDVTKLKWLATDVTKLKWLATDVTKLKWLATDVTKLRWLATDVTKLKWLATDVTKLNLNENHELLTYDIKDLYVNISIKDTLTITNSMLLKSNVAQTRQHIIILMKIILSRNYFTFQNKIYQQGKGVTVGSPTPSTSKNSRNISITSGRYTYKTTFRHTKKTYSTQDM